MAHSLKYLLNPDPTPQMRALLNPQPSPDMEELFRPKHGIKFERNLKGRVKGAAMPLANEAVLYLDAQYSKAGEPRVINQGTGGSALDAKYGSVLGAYVYAGKAVLPGIAGNYLSVPDEAAFTPTSTLDVRAGVSLADWASGSPQTVLAHYSTASSLRSYALQVDATGNLDLVTSPTGVTGTGSPSTVAIPVSDGQSISVRAVWTASTSIVYYTKPWVSTSDLALDTGWTQLGVTKTSSIPAALFDTSAVLSIGEITSAGQRMVGSVHSASVECDGTTVLDIDMADVPDYATSFTATTGQTVTVNSTTSDTNDPLLLTHTGENYVYPPPVAGNQLLVGSQLIPHGVDFTVELDIDHSVGAARTSQGLFSASTNAGWRARWSAVNTIQLEAWNGAAWGNAMTATLPTQTGRFKLRLDFDFNNGSGNSATTFSYSTDGGATWTGMGTTTASGTVTPSGTPTGTDLFLRDAAGSASGYLDGKAYGFKVLDAAGSTTFEFNAATDITDAGATSFTATSGQTVTVNRATSGRKTALVTRPVWLFGTDDYLEIADNALLDITGPTDPLTVVFVGRHWSTVTASIVAKSNDLFATTAGWGMYGPNRMRVSDGVALYTSLLGTGAVSGQLTTMIGISDSNTVTANSNNSVNGTPGNSTGMGSAANGTVLRIGRNGTASVSYGDFECLAVAVLRRAVTADEIAAINSFYGTV